MQLMTDSRGDKPGPPPNEGRKHIDEQVFNLSGLGAFFVRRGEDTVIESRDFMSLDESERASVVNAAYGVAQAVCRVFAPDQPMKLLDSIAESSRTLRRKHEKRLKLAGSHETMAYMSVPASGSSSPGGGGKPSSSSMTRGSPSNQIPALPPPHPSRDSHHLLPRPGANKRQRSPSMDQHFSHPVEREEWPRGRVQDLEGFAPTPPDPIQLSNFPLLASPSASVTNTAFIHHSLTSYSQEPYDYPPGSHFLHSYARILLKLKGSGQEGAFNSREDLDGESILHSWGEHRDFDGFL